MAQTRGVEDEHCSGCQLGVIARRQIVDGDPAVQQLDGTIRRDLVGPPGFQTACANEGGTVTEVRSGCGAHPRASTCGQLSLTTETGSSSSAANASIARSRSSREAATPRSVEYSSPRTRWPSSWAAVARRRPGSAALFTTATASPSSVSDAPSPVSSVTSRNCPARSHTDIIVSIGPTPRPRCSRTHRAASRAAEGPSTLPGKVSGSRAGSHPRSISWRTSPSHSNTAA